MVSDSFVVEANPDEMICLASEQARACWCEGLDLRFGSGSCLKKLVQYTVVLTNQGVVQTNCNKVIKDDVAAVCLRSWRLKATLSTDQVHGTHCAAFWSRLLLLLRLRNTGLGKRRVATKTNGVHSSSSGFSVAFCSLYTIQPRATVYSVFITCYYCFLIRRVFLWCVLVPCFKEMRYLFFPISCQKPCSFGVSLFLTSRAFSIFSTCLPKRAGRGWQNRLERPPNEKNGDLHQGQQTNQTRNERKPRRKKNLNKPNVLFKIHYIKREKKQTNMTRPLFDLQKQLEQQEVTKWSVEAWSSSLGTAQWTTGRGCFVLLFVRGGLEAGRGERGSL